MCLPFFLFVSGGSRTPGLLDRNQTLYPAELRRQPIGGYNINKTQMKNQCVDLFTV